MFMLFIFCHYIDILSVLVAMHLFIHPSMEIMSEVDYWELLHHWSLLRFCLTEFTLKIMLSKAPIPRSVTL